jgi:hypothetical protein
MDEHDQDEQERELLTVEELEWALVEALEASPDLDGRPRRTMLHTCLQSAWQLRSMAPLWRCEGRGHATRDAPTPGTDR